jgi:1,2-diacylglycerol 3-beta-galactosyltransferase
MAPTDIFKTITGAGLEDIYNLLLQGWTLGTRQALPIMHGMIRLYHSPRSASSNEFWRQDTPTSPSRSSPNFNCAMLQALRRITPRTPFVTILTDMADFSCPTSGSNRKNNTSSAAPPEPSNRPRHGPHA